MTPNQSLEIAFATDAGLVREYNEDSIAADPALGLVILADGMGGYRAGDIASRMATATVLGEVRRIVRDDPPSVIGAYATPQARALRQAIVRANSVVFKTSQQETRYRGMGTTLVSCFFHDDRVTVAHIGDSRLYRLRGGRLQQITTDHSLLQEQVELGLITADDAKASHNRNLVTRALGVDASVELDMREERTVPGDVYLLCSDGLNDLVDDESIELALSTLNENLPLTAEMLIQIANDNGGHDNVSVIVIKVKQAPKPKGFLQKLVSRWIH